MGAGSLGDSDLKCGLYQEACRGLDRDTDIIQRRCVDAAGLDVEGGGKTGRETPDSGGGDRGGSQVSKGSHVGQLQLPHRGP